MTEIKRDGFPTSTSSLETTSPHGIPGLPLQAEADSQVWGELTLSGVGHSGSLPVAEGSERPVKEDGRPLARAAIDLTPPQDPSSLIDAQAPRPKSNRNRLVVIGSGITALLVLAGTFMTTRGHGHDAAALARPTAASSTPNPGTVGNTAPSTANASANPTATKQSGEASGTTSRTVGSKSAQSAPTVSQTPNKTDLSTNPAGNLDTETLPAGMTETFSAPWQDGEILLPKAFPDPTENPTAAAKAAFELIAYMSSVNLSTASAKTMTAYNTCLDVLSSLSGTRRRIVKFAQHFRISMPDGEVVIWDTKANPANFTSAPNTNEATGVPTVVVTNMGGPVYAHDVNAGDPNTGGMPQLVKTGGWQAAMFRNITSGDAAPFNSPLSFTFEKFEGVYALADLNVGIPAIN